MDTIGVINPGSGDVHYIPYEDLGAAMEAGGKFADESQKQKAIQLQSGSSNESQIPSSPFNQHGKSQESPEPKEKTGWKALGADTLDMLQGALKGGIGFLGRAPANIKDINQQVAEHGNEAKKHNLGQLLAGGATLGKAIINAPHDLSKEFASKELLPYKPANDFVKWGSKLIPHIPEDTGIEEKLGLQPTRKSDEFIRALPAALTTALGAVRVGKGAVKWATAPSKKTAFLREMEKEVADAKKTYNLSEEQIEKLRDKLKLEYSEKHGGDIGELTPVGQQVAINKKTRAIKDRAEEAGKHIESGEPLVKPDVKGAEEALSGALESTRAHEKHGGKIYQDAIVEDKNTASKLYNEYREDLSKNEIKVNNSSEIEEVTKELNKVKDESEFAPGYGHGSKKQLALEAQLKKLETETVNAADVFSLKRTLDTLAEQARDRQFATGITDEERKVHRLRADSLENKADKLGKVLENVGGKEASKKLKNANEIWSKYASVRNHPMGRALLKTGHLPPNTIGKLTTKSAHSGIQRAIDYLNKIKDESPQLQKHILSQKYGKKSQFEHLLNPKEEVEPYLANRDELHPHIENLRETKHAATQHEALASAMKAAKETSEIKGQIKFHENAIPQIKEKIKIADAAGEDHAKLDEELKMHKQNLQDKNYRLKQLVGVALKVTGISAIAHKAGL
jgi:hypothetical protein